MISFNSISILSLGFGLNLKIYMDLLLIWGSIYPQNIILPFLNTISKKVICDPSYSIALFIFFHKLKGKWSGSFALQAYNPP